MKQNELKEGRLLDYEGNLYEAGYSTSLIKKYKRKDIVGLKSRIKERDYYAVFLKDYVICFTISDCSIFSLVSVSVIDLIRKRFKTKSKIKFFSFGKLNLPSSSEIGDVVYSSKDFSLTFLNNGNNREIKASIKNFYNNKDLDADIILTSTTNKSMVIATPFKKKKHFYYNQKINNLLSNGYFKLGDKLYSIKDGVAVLDWGRGVWTYKNTWYWASLSLKEGDTYKGFNLGYGFGDTSKASENMLFINKDAYKLDDVKFYFTKKNGKEDFLGPIKLYSQNKDIDLTFTPILDRHEDTNALLIASFQHQIFGKFNGKIKTKDNKEVIFKDAIGFLEKVKNRW